MFGPLYDNGASLGWQLPESQIIEQMNYKAKMNKFYKNSKMKISLDNRETPRIKAKTVLKYLILNYRKECDEFFHIAQNIDILELKSFLENFLLITDERNL
ncbi:hypothetical protein ABID56_001133 [Alkalibacillus flavidus]|uniref:Uncharacterized protein n=1 Tax=Alkalibacillus flavidus TaxID=546021 RepID=A0ABV2KTY8_9BACI